MGGSEYEQLVRVGVGRFLLEADTSQETKSMPKSKKNQSVRVWMKRAIGVTPQVPTPHRLGTRGLGHTSSAIQCIVFGLTYKEI
jgi:hypothetical protein